MTESPFVHIIKLKRAPTYAEIIREGSPRLRRALRQLENVEPAEALCEAEMLVAVLARHTQLERGTKPWIRDPRGGRAAWEGGI